MKILIAEDDKTTRTLLVRWAQQWGYEPVLAQDGEEAEVISASNGARRLRYRCDILSGRPGDATIGGLGHPDSACLVCAPVEHHEVIDSTVAGNHWVGIFGV